MTRRSRKEIISESISKIDAKIVECNSKIQKLSDEKESLQSELKSIIANEAKAKEEADFKELRRLIKKKNISIDELKAMIESGNNTEE